jgi:hypothetical protein
VRTYYQANIIFLGRFPKLGAIKTVFVVLFPPCFCVFWHTDVAMIDSYG